MHRLSTPSSASFTTYQIASPGLTTATQSCSMTWVPPIIAYCNTSSAIQASRYSPHEVLPLRHSPHAVLSLRHSPHAVLSLRHSSHEFLPFRHQTVLCRCHAPGHAGLTLQLLSSPFYCLAPCRAVMNSMHPSMHFTHPGIRPMHALPSDIRQCGHELPASVCALYTSWHKANACLTVRYQAVWL